MGDVLSDVKIENVALGIVDTLGICDCEAKALGSQPNGLFVATAAHSAGDFTGVTTIADGFDQGFILGGRPSGDHR
jgi:hypothetical protein